MATELATAYFQIRPSAKGMQGSLTKEIGGEATKAGTLSGNSFGAMFKKAVAAAGIGLAVKKIVSDAFEQGGELQQNLGGTEAVFGQFASNVQKTAVDAYKNMGMSASDYMATANKMGSLFQGSGLEQQRAMDLTTAAMQRAADVASVMGIDTTMAMESIAGAAKGNFTMMDNLGVAMNATTLQAYALEKGVNFDWNTASNAEKAELAMQMFMERTTQYAGNFARESEETWSGSIGAMKSAYQNLLGNLMLGNDLGQSLKALAQTITTFIAGNLIPAVINIFGGLPGALVTLISTLAPQLIAAIMGLIPQIASGITTALPQLYQMAQQLISQIKIAIETQLPSLLEEGVKVVTNITNGILQNIPQIITIAGSLITNFIGAILPAIPRLLEAGGQLLLNLVNGIVNNLPQIITAAARAIIQFIATIRQNLPQILQSGIELIGKLAAGLVRAIPTLIGKIPQIITSIKNEFTNVDWGSIGRNIISGIATGLKNAGSMLWDAAKGVLGSFKDNVLDFFGIHSPARWGIYVGEMIDRGVAGGVTGNKSIVTKAMEELTKATTTPFSAAHMTHSWSGGGKDGRNQEILEQLNILIALVKMLLSKKAEISLTLRERELIRVLKELGVVFE